jgi:antitoxin ParD1/3/4
MNISLTPQLESMIREKVDSGLYNNSSEVVSEALRLMEQRDKVERLREAVTSTQEQIARGEGISVTPEYLAALSLEVDERDRRGDQPSADVLP